MMPSGAVALTYLGALLFGLGCLAAIVAGFVCRRFPAAARWGAVIALPAAAAALGVVSIDFDWGTALSGSIIIAAMTAVSALCGLLGHAARRAIFRLSSRGKP